VVRNQGHAPAVADFDCDAQASSCPSVILLLLLNLGNWPDSGFGTLPAT
jgi:hypothetical protein